MTKIQFLLPYFSLAVILNQVTNYVKFQGYGTFTGYIRENSCFWGLGL
uniref:Uncharacterized protein n=1 Tax=Rhizophora mucronata TaxID=61149 RepID=A0A2P2KDW8_RHIMU